jgi:hypothetical protein
LLVLAIAGITVESSRAADVDSITAPTTTETYYGDWDDIRLTFTASQSTPGGVDWEVVSGLPSSGLTYSFSSGTTGNLDLSRVGRGPDAGLYTIVVKATGADSSSETASVDFRILPRPVNIDGSFSVLGKTYNGDAEATIDDDSLTLESQSTDGFVGRGIITLDADLMTLNAQAVFDEADAGTHTARLTGSTLTGSVDGRDLSGNYSLQLVGSGSYTVPTASGTISAKALSLAPSSLTFTKTYDGTTTITPTGTPALSSTGVIDGESTPTLSGSPTWTLDSAGAGSGKTVSITSGSYTLSDTNYSLSTTSLDTATVSKAELEVQFSVNAKQYDSTDALASSNITIDALSGLVGADSGTEASFTSAMFASSAVGTHDVELVGLTLDPASALDNYTVTQETQTGEINKKQLTLTGSFTANDKTFDASTTATGNVNSLGLTGRVGSETVTIDTDTVELSFSQADTGTGLTVSIDTVGLTGADAGNYEVSLPSAIVDTADIEARELTFPDPTVADKIYDSTDAATVTCTPSNVPDDETADVLVDCTNAVFDSADYTGSPGTITVTPVITVDGEPIDETSNYRLPASPSPYTFTLTQTIQKKPLTITGLAATDREYDGTTVVQPRQAVDGVDPSLVGIEDDDDGQVELNSGSAELSIASADASDDPLAVTASGYALTGDRAFNYQIQQPTALTVTISPRSVNVSVTGVDKTYDSNRNLPSGWACTVTPVTGGTITEDSTAGVSCGSGSYLNQEHVGTQTIRLYNVAVGNPNYEAQNIVLRTVNEVDNVPTVDVTGVISARDLVITNGTMQYNGTNSGDATYSTTKVAGDSLTVKATTTFNGSAVGSTSTSITGPFTVTGDDKDNYSYETSVGDQTATIIKNTIQIRGFVVSDKDYDATTTATVDVTSIYLTGFVTGEDVSIRPSSDLNPWPTFSFRTRHAADNIRLDRSGTFAIEGDDADKYTLQQPSGDNNGELRADIDPISLSVTGSFTADDKTYDGTTTATIIDNSLTLTGKASDAEYTLTLGTPTVVFDSVDAGSRTVSIDDVDFSVSGITNGSSESQIKNSYTFTYASVTDTADITQAPLAISGLDAVDRVYDGTTSVDPGGTPVLTGLIDGDEDYVELNSDSASLEMADAHYSADPKAVTVSGYTLGTGSPGDRSGNYSLSLPTDITVSISKAPLTISGADAVDRDYDATTDVTPGGSPELSGVVTEDADYVSLDASGATMSIGDANYSASPRAVTATGYALEGDRSDNYELSQPTGITVSIGKKTLPVTVTAADKTYDGTTTASLTAVIDDGGLYARDVGRVTASASGTFEQADVNTSGDGSITVTVSSVTLGGDRALNYSASNNSTASATIDPFELVLTPRADDKVYDGTTAVETDDNPGAVCEFTKPDAASSDDVSVDCSSAVFISGGGFAAEEVAFTGSGSSAVEIDKTVEISSISLGGTDSANYSLSATSDTAQAKILRAPLTLSNLIPQDKYYDGDRFATFDDSAAVLQDAGGNDVTALTFENLQGNFTSATPGTYFVRLSSWTLTGTGASNFRIDIDGTQRQADILARPLVIAVTASDKDYDGTDAVTLSELVTGANLGGVSSATGVIGSEVITLSATGRFDDVNAAENVGVSISGVTLGGADKDNYSVHSFTVSTTAEIRPIALTWSLDASNKTYDGSRDAGVVVADITDDRLAGDTFTMTFSSDLFDTADIGTNKTVTVSGLSISGGDSGNYTYSPSVTDQADITARTIAVTGTFSAASKVYDGGTAATVDDTSSLALGNVVSADEEGISLDTATASFDTSAVGTGKTVTLDALTITGTNSGNYTVDVSGVTDYTEGEITPKSLTPTITAQDRLWDGTTNATITGITLAGVITGDSVSVDTASAVGAFRDADQGSAKTVDVTNIRFNQTGAWANYVLDLTETAPGVYSGTTTATIQGSPLTISIVASDKTYDGTTAATVTVTFTAADDSTVTPTYSGGTATFSQADVGTNLLVTASGFTLTGADADEYVLSSTSATDRADISATTLGITADDKVYDGTDRATVDLDGVLSGDDVGFASAPTATFDDPVGDTRGKDVGVNKAVTATGISLTGDDSGNYTIGGTETATASISQRLLTPVFTPNPAVTQATSPVTVDVTDDRITNDVLTVDYTLAETIRRGNQLVLVVTNLTLSDTDSENYRVVSPYELVLQTFATPTRERGGGIQPPVEATPAPQAAPRVAPRPAVPPATGVERPVAPSPAPAAPVAEQPSAQSPDILPGWRPPVSSRATIDFGQGILERTSRPRDIADQIKVEPPSILVTDRFDGFEPQAPAQLEIMGAKTVTSIRVTAEDAGNPERLRTLIANALQQSPNQPGLPATTGPQIVSVGPDTPSRIPSPATREVLEDALAWLGLPPPATGPGVSDGTPVAELLWEVEGFRPGSSVFLVVTSDPGLVAWGTANDDGVAVLQGTLQEDSLIDGEHRLRIIGTSVFEGGLADDTGAVVFTEELTALTTGFDRDTRISVALWGANPEGADHVAVRYIDPELAVDSPVWWWLLLIPILWVLIVLWRRRQGDWTTPSGRVGTASTGAILATPAIVVGVVLTQDPLVPAGIAIAVVAALVAATIPGSRPAQNLPNRQRQRPA